MRKKKNIKKVKPKDPTFNSILKDRYYNILLGNYEKVYSKWSYDKQIVLNNFFKNSFIKYTEKFPDDVMDVDIIHVVSYFNFLEEMFFLDNIGKHQGKEILRFIRNKMVEYMNKYNCSLNVLLAITNYAICIDYNGSSAEENEISFREFHMYKMLMLQFIGYTVSYTTNLKNKIIKEIVQNEYGILDIIYDNKPYLTQEDIDTLELRNCDVEKWESVNNKVTFYLESVFLNKYISPESIVNSSVPIRFKDNLNNIPLRTKDGVYLFSESELNTSYNKRKYAIPSGGIKLEVIDKSKDIESIIIKETNKFFLLTINVRNNSNISINSNKYLGNISLISFFVKNRLDDDNLTASVNSINRYVGAPNSDLFFNNYCYVMLSALYVALCDYKAGKEFNISYADNSDSSSFVKSTRKSGFRIGHIRKLPLGSKASEDALQRAKEEGFMFIPEGYTFVRATGIEDSDTENYKVIKIK